MISRFGQIVQVHNLLAPVDTAATALLTEYMNMQYAHRATIGLQFGVVTATSTDQAVTVTLLAATSAATTSATAIAFKYRLSEAIGDTEALGAITTATSSGVSVATTDDNKMLLIDVDPGLMAAVASDAKYVYAKITPDAGGTVSLASGFGLIEPRYDQLDMKATYTT